MGLAYRFLGVIANGLSVSFWSPLSQLLFLGLSILGLGWPYENSSREGRCSSS